MITRRILLSLPLTATLVAGASLPAHAQPAFPTKVIRIQVGYAAGGPTDNVARVFAGKLSAELGQQVIVDNKPGAGGTLAAAAVAKAAPDGYTLLLGEPGSMAVSAAQATQLPYDPVKDFTPIGQVVSLPMVLVASPSLKVGTLAELLALAKTRPLAFGTPGSGTMQHLTMAQFGQVTGTRFTHVSYRGGAPAVVDLLGGQIPLAMVTVPSVAAHVKAGTLVALAVVSTRRSEQLPQTPTFPETGYPSFIQDGWQGFFAPANTPKDVVARLSAALAKAGRDPELLSALSATGANVVLSDPVEFGKVLQRDVAYWATVVATNPSAKD